MLQTLLEDQRAHLEFFYQHLDRSKAEEILDLCLNTRGLIVLSGVGKSGIVAEKIAMTLVSTGTRAIFLAPINFLHGDLGIVSHEDLVIVLSKSGETQELIHLLPFIRKKGAKTVAWVSNLQSRLALEADIAILLPVEKELCPFDLAPTISAEVQLLFGDVLAVGIMKKRGFTLSAYGENHPAGTIGYKATIKVRDIMLTDLPLCQESATLEEVLPTFSNKRLGCILILNPQDGLQGIFTDGDLRRALQRFGPALMNQSITELMTPFPLFVESHATAWEALKLMQKDPKRWVSVLPVVEQEKVVGIVRMHDMTRLGVS